MPSITVYLSSSKDVDAVYHDAATALGKSIAAAGWTLVYGGNPIGLMGKLSDGARAGGGKVVGITPQLMADEGIADKACDELIVTTTMRERKHLLETRGDAFIAMPGGMGTFEELFEILVGRILGYHVKPIILLNIAGYYDPLLAMIEHGIVQRFIKPRAKEAYFVATTVDGAIRHLHDCFSGRLRREHPEGEPSARE
ncbi:LOG family protein [Humisphaera borealis]|uniref:Cytokinin riboside 5'-monophosphate phosphoribohydrolase n=1 Tax=Humisphaera borealis TaxID=2807512 RepID=A0A7M2X0A5_9BACT|nr:TIGR00730 family Rossman fold protein [Humisphaera borealis]QOV91103.1 TIGR00730 family Rossman fold protein [Humisphaera borealis]